jgi:two-component system, OmpR family, phosphate regulon sensor histidine kinase PhoR
LPSRWLSHLFWLALWLVGAFLLGLWFGRPGWWLFAALTLYVANTLRNLYLLDRFTAEGKRPPLFETRGLWPELVARIDKLKLKSRNRKKRYHRLLREVRESTGALSDAGIILNSENEIVWFNPAATRLLGLEPGHDLGHRIDNLLRHPGFVEYLETPGETSITVPSPVAESGWLSVQLIPYGRQQRLAIIRDVTHEVTLERTRRDFVANASHELRSPLTVITGYLDTLADDHELPASWEVPITEMLRQANRMTQILRDLIELTRLESEGSEAKHDFVDVAGMLAAIVREFETRRERPQLELELESDAALLGNESELHSIFHNLINNAVRFTPVGGRVTVVWRADAGGAEFAVRDTGIGIAPEQIPRLTERFYRVDPGRSRATGGTGLGLAIVKHALQRHQATLKVESREGEGSTFTCHFSPARLVFRGGSSQAVV